MSDWLLVVAAAVLIAACGVFVAAEFSFVTVDRAAVDRDAEAGDRRAAGLRSALQSLSTQLSGAQLGITVTNLAIGFLAEPAIAGLAGGALTGLGLDQSKVPEVSLIIGLVLATVLTMVFGELVPKNLAIARPRAVAEATQAYQRGFTKAMAYPIRLLNGAANATVRRLGVEPQEELRSSRSPAELASLVQRSADQGTLDLPTADLIQRALSFGSRTAGEIMTPRVRMHSLEGDEPAEAVLEAARHSGRSRFPVLNGGFDTVTGVVHVKHALAVPVEHRSTTSVRAISVPALMVPSSLTVEQLMPILREEGLQLGVVVDEYGGTAGVVTLEDVVEEIVGEIDDEHDPGRRPARKEQEGEWVLSGLLRPDEVHTVTQLILPGSSDYDTLAGMVLHGLGHLPVAGESLTIAAERSVVDASGLHVSDPCMVELTVQRMERRRIDQVRVLLLTDQAATR